jgi:anaerobic magnesium-protoporphyrin IX monomethyl ester cyclase
MDVLLARPPRRSAHEMSLAVPPLGLAYVAASLRAAGHRVRIVDAAVQDWSWERFEQELAHTRPDVVGLSAMTPVADLAARAARAARPHARFVILGGPHPTAVRERVFAEMPELDAAVVGEGETVAPALLDWLSAPTPSPPPGVLAPGHAFEGAAAPDIHAIVPPARDLLPMQRYRYLFATRPGFATMVTSRGCPFHCTFCDKSVSGSRWRARGAEDVVEEMHRLVVDHQIGFINFYDDNFTLRRARVVQICEEILRRGIDVEWKCEGRVDGVDLPLLRLMRRAGCRTVAYGVESGNQSTLDLLRKDVRVEQAPAAFAATRAAGIRSLAYIILGAPGETALDVQNTIDFCHQIRADYVQFSTLVAMPGTPLFAQHAHGAGVPNPLDADASRATVTQLDPEVLARLLRQAWSGFYLRPGPMWRLARDARASGSIDEGARMAKGLGRWLLPRRSGSPAA